MASVKRDRAGQLHTWRSTRGNWRQFVDWIKEALGMNGTLNETAPMQQYNMINLLGPDWTRRANGTFDSSQLSGDGWTPAGRLMDDDSVSQQSKIGVGVFVVKFVRVFSFESSIGRSELSPKRIVFVQNELQANGFFATEVWEKTMCWNCVLRVNGRVYWVNCTTHIKADLFIRNLLDIACKKIYNLFNCDNL